MSAVIRAMAASDMPDVLRIYGAGIEAGGATFERECPTIEVWDTNHLPQCRLVAEADSTVIGWAALSRASPRHAYRGVAELSIYVDPACQGLGLGRLLLRALMDSARANGLWTLQATVFAANRRSARLHEALGFRLVGRREKIAQDRRGEWTDTLLYEWRNEIE